MSAVRHSDSVTHAPTSVLFQLFLMDSHRLLGVVPRAMQQALVYFIQESACVNFKFLLYLLSAFDSLRQRETEGN